MPDYCDFVLPGLRTDPRALTTLISSISVAYSSVSNRRRLENPLYAFWSEVLHLLVEDFESEILVAPQFSVYKASDDLPNTSLGTIPDKDAEEKVPDFVLLGVFLAERHNKELLQQSAYPKLTYDGWHLTEPAISRPLTIFEGKRMAGRHYISSIDFQIDLSSCLAAATTGAEHQARIIFEEKSYHAKSLILIAAAGEWWQFQFVTRAKFMNMDRGHGKSQFVTVQSQSSGMGGKKKKGLSRFSTIDTKTEPAYTDVKKARPLLGSWSDYICFGSKASNQRLYLIHEELKKISKALKVDAVAQLKEWIENGYESEDTVASESEDELNLFSDNDE